MTFEDFEAKVRLGLRDYRNMGDLQRKKRHKRKKQQGRSRQLVRLYREGQICHICLEFVERDEASIDHIDPEGPRRDMSNMKLAHKKCNQVRNRNTTWDVFQLGLFLAKKRKKENNGYS